MLIEKIQTLFRKRSLKKSASTRPTGLCPISRIRSAVTFIDVEDTSFDVCKKAIQALYRDNGIKGEIFFFDFRKIGDKERLITSITNTILKKDLNWYGKPAKEKVDLLLQGEPDLFISLINKDDFPIEFIAKTSTAHFKIGRRQLPGNTFDLVIKDPADKPYSEAEVFGEVVRFIDKIQ